MSWIGNNVLNTPFSGFSAQPPETQPGQTYGEPGLPVRAQPDAMVASFPSGGAFSGAGGGFGGGSLGGGEGGSGLSAMMSGFAAYVNSLFNQIAAWYGSGATGSGTSAAGANPNAQCPPGSQASGQCTGTSGSPNESWFANATASSWGDPHDTFDGTGANGQNVNGSWDNMRSHADLLDSNSISGGYQVSTQVTQANAQGVTMNQSASIATNSGNTVVSLNASGQYQISSYGQKVTLQPGQTAQLGGGESVTLNGDGSLTVADSSASGGQISTTLKANGNGGVDVKAQASNVDLGGYLVSRGDGARPQPVAPIYPQPRPISRAHPDAPVQNSVESPFDQIDQITN